MSNRFHQNLSPTDRALRVLIGLVAISLAIAGPQSAWGYLGFIPLLTAAVGYCPVYAMLGISTRSGKRI
ncbi:MAG TPA: DUF2892 domain-containing protein [Gemmatimonadaceae bacterium]